MTRESEFNLGYQGPIRQRAITPGESIKRLYKRNGLLVPSVGSWTTDPFAETARLVVDSKITGTFVEPQAVIFSFDGRKPRVKHRNRNGNSQPFEHYAQFLKDPEDRAYTKENARISRLHVSFKQGLVPEGQYRTELGKAVQRKKDIAQIRSAEMTQKQIEQALGNLRKLRKQRKIDELTYQTRDNELKRKMALLLHQQGKLSVTK